MSTAKNVSVETDLAIRRLIARYAQLLDDRDTAAVVDLFTEDARFHIDGHNLNGRPAVKEWLDTLVGEVSHSVTNVVVSGGSQPGTHHAVSDLALRHRGEDGEWTKVALGRYHDTLVGEGRDLRFSQRILKMR